MTDTACPRHEFLPGHIEAGARVPCPNGDHDHDVVVVAVIHTALVETSTVRS